MILRTRGSLHIINVVGLSAQSITQTQTDHHPATPQLLLHLLFTLDIRFFFSLHLTLGTVMLLHLRESVPRMARSQRDRGKSNHHAIQDDEISLVPHDGTAPAIGHLRNTVHASREDGHVREEDGAGEELEAERGHELVRRFREAGAVAVDSGGVQRGEGAEDEQGHDLPHDARNHHVVSCVQ